MGRALKPGNSNFVALHEAAKAGGAGICPPALLPLGWVMVLVLALLLFTLPAQTSARTPAKSKPGAGESEKPPEPPDLSALLSEEEGEWLSELQEMRSDMPGSRRKLILAIQSKMESKSMWRVYHHMAEFGEQGDIPILLERLERLERTEGVEGDFEKRVLRGAVRALYQGAGGKTELSRVLEEFSFVRTKPPSDLKDGKVGRLWLSSSIFDYYHRSGIPMEVLNLILPLKGRSYATDEGLADALERSLGKKRWETYGPRLLEPMQPRPRRTVQEGMLRIRISNHLQHPLLLQVEFDPWGGEFDPSPEPDLLFLESGQSLGLDRPVRLIAVKNGLPVRVDLRIREVGGPPVPIFQKLYITE